MNKLLKKVISVVVALSVVSFGLFACGKNNSSGKVVVRLNEVVRSSFYAPMYVAINQGFFEDEGIEIDLSTGQGADKTMQQVLSGNADIGFCGPEQVIYINNQGREDYPVVFAQLTQRDGSFLVGREKEDNFQWSDLKGKEIIGGRPGGMPEMSFEYVLKKNGIDTKDDVQMVTNIDFTATSGAFKANTGDYVTLFEPTASMLEKDKSGYIVASVGESAGDIPYTCFFATKSYIDENPEIVEKFVRAIHKGQLWVDTHSDEEVVNSISGFFPGTDKEILIKVIKNYRSIEAYAITPVVKEESMNRLMDIIESYDKELIPKRPDFNKIVNNEFSEKIIKEE